ncbi:prepilin-type N-terminal cleavage/methylation domain-containing protein [Bacillus sp. JJ1503]|uniref:type IV pilin protein n=1 Tax=unclassified Bacillus (in: firmicutes) TaxID=185979 RepID=UPI002FFFBB2A
MLKRIGKRLKDQRGLTLVELLAVVVILGIIAAIAVPSIGNVIAKSKYDAAKADAIQLISAGKLYVASNGAPETANKDIKSTDSPNPLAEYIEISNNNLASWTVTISTTGAVTVTATSNHKPKAGTTTIGTTVAEINALKYETGGK